MGQGQMLVSGDAQSLSSRLCGLQLTCRPFLFLVSCLGFLLCEIDGMNSILTWNIKNRSLATGEAGRWAASFKHTGYPLPHSPLHREGRHLTSIYRWGVWDTPSMNPDILKSHTCCPSLPSLIHHLQTPSPPRTPSSSQPLCLPAHGRWRYLHNAEWAEGAICSPKWSARTAPTPLPHLPPATFATPSRAGHGGSSMPLYICTPYAPTPRWRLEQHLLNTY